MELGEALREENRRLRRLRIVVDLTIARLYQDPDMTLLEALHHHLQDDVRHHT